MANTNDMREAFKDFRDQRNKELKANGLNDQSSFWITNSHYTAWCRGVDWGQSQQVQVTEFDKKLFDSECRESVAGALGFQKGGDYAWSYLLAQIKEAVAATDMLTTFPAPDHTTDAGQMAEALRGLLSIISDSRGVDGYHLNGDIGEWDEFEEVGFAIDVYEAHIQQEEAER